ATARRHAACDSLTRELNSLASSRFGRSGRSSYARMIESRNFARMMQPAFQMRAISRMSMFQFHSFDPAWINAMPCAYEQIFEAYSASCTSLMNCLRFAAGGGGAPPPRTFDPATRSSFIDD